MAVGTHLCGKPALSGYDGGMLKRWLYLSLAGCLLFALPVGLVADGFGQSRPSFSQIVRYVQLAQLERVADRLRSAIPNPPQFELLVFDDPSINAGATFGRVMVSTGMLNFVRSDDELAVIVGHEIAHLSLGHVSQGAFRSSLLGLASLLVDSVYPGIGLLTGQVGRLFLNHYNQDQEREADALGLRYAFDAGYDPRAGAEVMRRMAREVPETATAGFFSSHPSSPERATTLRQLAARLTANSPAPAPVALSSPSPPTPRFERDEDACRRARSYFYRALAARSLRQKVRLYDWGLGICPHSPRARFELAEVYARLGQTERATAQLRAVLRYDPAYPGARQRLRSLQQR